MEDRGEPIARFVVAKVGFLRDSKRVLTLYANSVVVSEQGIDVVKHEHQYPQINLETAQDVNNRAFTMKVNGKAPDRYTALHRPELLCLFSKLKNRHQILFSGEATLVRYNAQVRLLVYSASIAYDGDKHSNEVLFCDIERITHKPADSDTVVKIHLKDGAIAKLKLAKLEPFAAAVRTASQALGISVPVVPAHKANAEDAAMQVLLSCPAIKKSEPGREAEEDAPVTLRILLSGSNVFLEEEDSTGITRLAAQAIVNLVFTGAKALLLQLSTGQSYGYEFDPVYAIVGDNHLHFVSEPATRYSVRYSESFIRDTFFIAVMQLMSTAEFQPAWSCEPLRRGDRLAPLGAPVHPRYEEIILQLVGRSEDLSSLHHNLRLILANIATLGVKHKEKAPLLALGFFIQPNIYPSIPTNLLSLALVALHRLLFSKHAFEEVNKPDMRETIQGVLQLLLHEDSQVALAAAHTFSSMVVQRSHSHTGRREPANRKAVFQGKNLRLVVRACFGSIDYGFRQDRVAVSYTILDVLVVVFTSKSTDKKLLAALRALLLHAHVLNTLMQLARMPLHGIRRLAFTVLLKLMQDVQSDKSQQDTIAIQTMARENASLLWFIFHAVNPDLQDASHQAMCQEIVAALIHNNAENALVLLRCFPPGLLTPIPSQLQFDIYGKPLWSLAAVDKGVMKALLKPAFEKATVSVRQCHLIWHRMMLKEVTEQVAAEIESFDHTTTAYGSRFLWNSSEFEVRFGLLQNETKVNRFYLSELSVALTSNDPANEVKPFLREHAFSFLVQCFLRLQVEENSEAFKAVVTAVDVIYEKCIPTAAIPYFPSGLALIIRNPLLAEHHDPTGALTELINCYRSILRGHKENRQLFVEHGSVLSVTQILQNVSQVFVNGANSRAIESATILCVESCHLLAELLASALPTDPSTHTFWPRSRVHMALTTEQQLCVLYDLLDNADSNVLSAVLHVLENIASGIADVNSVLTPYCLLKLLRLAAENNQVESVSRLLYIELINQFRIHRKDAASTVLALCSFSTMLPAGMIRLLALEGPDAFAAKWSENTSQPCVVWNQQCRDVLRSACNEQLQAAGAPDMQAAAVPYVAKGCVPVLYIFPYYLTLVPSANTFNEANDFLDEAQQAIERFLKSEKIANGQSANSNLEREDLSTLISCLVHVLRHSKGNVLSTTLMLRLANSLYKYLVEGEVVFGYVAEEANLCGQALVLLAEKLFVRGIMCLTIDQILEIMELCQEHNDVPTCGVVLRIIGSAAETFLTSPEVAQRIPVQEFVMMLRRALQFCVRYLPTYPGLAGPCSDFARTVLESSPKATDAEVRAAITSAFLRTNACFMIIMLFCASDAEEVVTQHAVVAFQHLLQAFDKSDAEHRACVNALHHLLSPGFVELAQHDSLKFFTVVTTAHENPAILWNQSKRSELFNFLQRGLQQDMEFDPMIMTYTNNEVVINGIYIRLFIKYACWPVQSPDAFLASVMERLHAEIANVGGPTDPTPHGLEVLALAVIRLVTDHLSLIDRLLQGQLLQQFVRAVVALLTSVPARSKARSAMLHILSMALKSSNTQHVERLGSNYELITGMCDAAFSGFDAGDGELLYTCLYFLFSIMSKSRPAVDLALQRGILFPCICLFAGHDQESDTQILAAAILTSICVDQSAYDRIRSVFPTVIVGQLAADLFAAARLVYTDIRCPTITWSTERRQQVVEAVKVAWQSWSNRKPGAQPASWTDVPITVPQPVSDGKVIGGLNVDKYLENPGFVLTHEQRLKFATHTLKMLEQNSFTAKEIRDKALVALSLVFRTCDTADLDRLITALFAGPRLLRLVKLVDEEMALPVLNMFCQMATRPAFHRNIFALLQHTNPFHKLADLKPSPQELRVFSLWFRAMLGSGIPERNRYVASLRPAQVVNALLSAVDHVQEDESPANADAIDEVYKLIAAFVADDTAGESAKQALRERGKMEEMEARSARNPSFSTVNDDIEAALPGAPTPVADHPGYMRGNKSGNSPAAVFKAVHMPASLDRQSLVSEVAPPPPKEVNMVELVPEPSPEVRERFARRRRRRPSLEPAAAAAVATAAAGAGAGDSNVVPAPAAEIGRAAESADRASSAQVESKSTAQPVVRADPDIDVDPFADVLPYEPDTTPTTASTTGAPPPPPPPPPPKSVEDATVRATTSDLETKKEEREPSKDQPPPPSWRPPPPPLAAKRASLDSSTLDAIRAGAHLRKVETSTPPPPAPVNEEGIFGALKQAMASRRFSTAPDDFDERSSFNSDK